MGPATKQTKQKQKQKHTLQLTNKQTTNQHRFKIAAVRVVLRKSTN
jgi:hypothetical protein